MADTTERIDPRFLRSRARLREAVLSLATMHPVAELSVAQVCREAGISRDTFYRHAESPIDLLALTLAAELGEALAEADSGDIRAGELILLTHIAGRAGVYRGAMTPQVATPLRANLERVIRESLEEYLRLHPEIVPAEVSAESEFERRVLTSYAAAGTVGAIEVWLGEPELDIDRAVRLILASSPGFWLSE